MKYKKQALFIYDEHSEDFIEALNNNDFGTEIIAVEKDHFLNDPLEYISMTNHLLLAGDMQLIDELVEYAYSHSANGQDCTLGFLPLESQKTLRTAYQLSKHLEDNIEVALRDETQAINLLKCNEQLVQFKVVIGHIPLLETWHSDLSPSAFAKNVILGVKQFFQLSLEKVSIETQRGKQIKTLASALFIVNQNQASRLSRVLLQKSSIRSEQLSLMIISPYSAVEYFLFLFSLIFRFNKEIDLPHAVSNIKSEEVTIDMDTASAEGLKVKLDEHKSTTFPLHFRVIKKAIKINAPEAFWDLNPVLSSDKETIQTHNLPDEKEINKYYKKDLPLFSVASEERFKELFLQLRSDARINSLYLVLMLLSTLLASFGLYANSAAVVIGAMLLAPLMSPIISFSMGLLRDDENMLLSSLIKISVGIVLAISASSLLTLLLPQVDLSNEIKARTHPNLIDLGVAIFSGIAAAYTKAHKELLNNLAGVAIAVALVPPLAVVGIGLGRGEAYVFEGALLLFMTNIIGITLSAVITFQFLGFSNTVKRKKNVLLIFTILLLLSYPLYRSYTDSILRYQLTKNLIDETMLINQQPVQIEKATIEYQNNLKIINITIVLQRALNEAELLMLKEKIKKRFASSYQIRMSMKFIL